MELRRMELTSRKRNQTAKGFLRPLAASPRRRVPLSWRIAVWLCLLCLTGCGLMASGSPRQIVPGGDVARGRELLDAYGCDACHTIPGVRGAIATVGPSLDDWPEQAYIAGALINNPENLMDWIQMPQEIEPGTAMPNLGVSEEEARHMAAFLFNTR